MPPNMENNDDLCDIVSSFHFEKFIFVLNLGINFCDRSSKGLFKPFSANVETLDGICQISMKLEAKFTLK